MSLCPPDLDWTAVPYAGQDCSVPDSVLVVENLCQVSGQKGFRAPDWTFACPLSEERLSGKRTKRIPCSGQDCSVSDSVLVVEKLFGADKTTSFFRTGLFCPGQRPRSGEPLSGKRTKVLQFSGQDCSTSDSVLVVENICQVSGQKGFRAPDRSVPSRTVT